MNFAKKIAAKASSLDCCKSAAVPTNAYQASTGCTSAPMSWVVPDSRFNHMPCNQEETESVMEARVQVTTDDTVADQRRHLSRRAYDIKCELDSKAGKVFGLHNDGTPTSWPELLKVIEEGKFEYDAKRAEEDGDDEYGWMGPFGYVKFKDPAIKKDKKGYNAWFKTLQAAYTAVIDDIKILEPAQALESVKAFEKYAIA